MIITEFSATDFRNLNNLNLTFHEKVNVIFGENAQGKTNILEGIWLFSGLRSFRGAKEREMIAFGRERATLSVNFFAGQREQNAGILLSGAEKKKLTLNEVKEENFRRIGEKFKVVVFSPIHLSLIKGSPAERRNFIDTSLCQIKGGYYSLMSEYSRTLVQRNALLKDARNESSLIMLLDIWEQRLCFIGAKIIMQRKKYICELQPVISEIFGEISEGRENITLRYSEYEEMDDEEKIREALEEKLKKSRADDFAALTTSAGPHREDVIIEINGRSARAFGSQGQQRSCALALKIGEAAVLKKITGETPVILLDDVMSELDARRQEYIFGGIRDNQVFITCCEPTSLLRGTSGNIYEINNGEAALCR